MIIFQVVYRVEILSISTLLETFKYNNFYIILRLYKEIPINYI